VIESFKKKLWTFLNDYNARAWNCERANKGIVKFVYSCVNFVFSKIGPSYYTFTPMKHRCHNVIYVLCMFHGTLSSGWQRFIIRCSNVCPYILKSMKQKVGAIDN
jgi:hypothetical protein